MGLVADFPPAPPPRGLRASFARTAVGLAGANTLRASLFAYWSIGAMVPDHDVVGEDGFAVDEVPLDAFTYMMVETPLVPEGGNASVATFHAPTRARLSQEGNLEVRNGLVRERATSHDGRPPQPPLFRVFDVGKLYEPEHREQPFVFFEARVNGRVKSSPTDFFGQPAELLRIKYLFTFSDDARAKETGLTSDQECAGLASNVRATTIAGGFQRSFQNGRHGDGDIAAWTSALRNTYAYHFAGHGTLWCDIDNRQAREVPEHSGHFQCPVNPAHPLTGKLALIDSVNHDTGVVTSATVVGTKDVLAAPKVPRYLAYLNCCLAGRDRAFVQAWLDKGTEFVIAFEVEIDDADASALAREFYAEWATTGFNPEELVTSFKKKAASHKELRPIIQRKGGPPEPLGSRAAANAFVETFASGFSSLLAT